MRLRALAAAAVVAAVVPLGAVSAAAADTYEVTVVHGITLAPEVDVLVDGEKAVGPLEFGEIASLPGVPAGSYDVSVALAGMTDPFDGLSATDVTVDHDVTVVAQFTYNQNGAFTLGFYPDDFSAIPAGQARVTVRHAADAPPVDVFANGGATPVITGLANGSQQTITVPAGSYSFQATVDGAADPGLALSSTPLTAGTSYVVYAVGEGDGGYELIVDAIDVGAAPSPSPTTSPAGPATTTSVAVPTAVPAGDGTSGWSGPLGLPAAVAIMLGLGVAVTVGLTVRRSSAGHR